MKYNKEIYIENFLISKDSPTFVIAEAGVNHMGSMKVAKELIDLASNAGADAVKFQAFKADNLILNDIKKAPYQAKTTEASETQFEMLKKLEVSREQNYELKQYCSSKGIIFLTTPFDIESLNELDSLDLPAYKIASTDTTNLPFLKKIAQKGKPMFLSTGMCHLSEVELALKSIYELNKEIVLLQCTANYPILDNEVNLAVLNTFRENFDILLGFSDHSEGVGAAPFAVSMGAKVVEKHFTINKNNLGPDHAASLSPRELIDFIKTVRKVDTYMGSGIKELSLSEHKTRRSLQKCIVANQDIKKGTLFSEENLTTKRTGGIGISPIDFYKILGTQSPKNYLKNEIIETIEKVVTE
jgi:N,N'-diacetyllegionaminate synthase